MYHLWELHRSDGNDNHITDVIVEADNIEDCYLYFDKWATEDGYEDSGQGDDEYLIYENLEEGEDSLIYSMSFIYQSSHDTYAAARGECARYHSGPVEFLAEGETGDAEDD